MLGKQIPDGEFCPLIKGQCVKRQCVAWQQIHGQDPQTGKILDEWGCSLFRWMPKLILEGAQQSRQAGAAVESFRNEMVKGRDALLGLASETKRLGNG
jgi:hypothetical protein